MFEERYNMPLKFDRGFLYKSHKAPRNMFVNLCCNINIKQIVCFVMLQINGDCFEDAQPEVF